MFFDMEENRGKAVEAENKRFLKYCEKRGLDPDTTPRPWQAGLERRRLEREHKHSNQEGRGGSCELLCIRQVLY